MARLIMLTFLFFLPFRKSFGQLNFDELEDLNILCKKGDYKSAHTFLSNKNYNIDVYNTNYDHGTYFTLCEIIATKSLNELNESIKIDVNEYNSYIQLSIYQDMYSAKNYLLTQFRVPPFWRWGGEKWTTIQTINDLDKSNITLGIQMYNLDFEDSSYIPVKSDSARLLFKNQNFLNNGKGYAAYLMNSNPKLDDIKFNMLAYKGGNDYYNILQILLRTRFSKGKNVTTYSEKTKTIPLMKNGSVYSLNVKFGKITKKYILDSGASDVSVDEETYQYLESSNQLKIENKMSESNYQLADGSIVSLKRLKIPAFLVNNLEVKNISGNIIENGKPLLLGKSFFDSFKSWKIDNENQVLVLELF